MEEKREKYISHIANQDFYIEDDYVQEFHSILARTTGFSPVDIHVLMIPDLHQYVTPILPTQEHLQLFFREPQDDTLLSSDAIGHWLCIHHVNGELRIYDSFYNNLTPHQCQCLASLFPHSPQIVFKSVQRQTNGIDCGVFAIAFATSIALGSNPCEQNFKIEYMRLHMQNIFNDGILSEFPTENSISLTPVLEGSVENIHSTTININSRPRGRPKNVYIGSKMERKRKHENDKKIRNKKNKKNYILHTTSSIVPFKQNTLLTNKTERINNDKLLSNIESSNKTQSLNEKNLLKNRSLNSCNRGRPKQIYPGTKIERNRIRESEKKDE